MTHRQQVLDLLADGGILRGRDFRNAGVPAVVLTRMLKADELESPQRGLYRLPHPEASVTDQRVAEISARHPSGVVCLMSALRYHDMTDDMHGEWNVAIRRRSPTVSPDWLTVVRWKNPDFYDVGVDTITVSGTQISITDRARTVADILRKVHGFSDEIALKAFSAFLKEGGDPIQVGDYAKKLGFAEDTRRIVPFAHELMSSGAFQTMDMTAFEF